MLNGGKEQKKRNKTKPKNSVCSCLRVGHSQEEEKGSTWFLKSLKAANRNRSKMNISKKGLAIYTGDLDLSHLPETQFESSLFCN